MFHMTNYIKKKRESMFVSVSKLVIMDNVRKGVTERHYYDRCHAINIDGLMKLSNWFISPTV